MALFIGVHPREYSAKDRTKDPTFGNRWGRDWDTCERSLTQAAVLIARRCWSPCLFSNGVRDETNFSESHVGALDFETSFYKIEQAIREWQDTECIIGTSQNHLVPKKIANWGVDIRHRFRVVFVWENPIYDLTTYRYNMEKLAERYGADGSCTDGARFFYPCREIVFLNEEGYRQPVVVAPKPVTAIHLDVRMARQAQAAAHGRKKPRWLHHFLTDGIIPPFSKFDSSRAWAVWGAAEALFSLGYNHDEICILINKAPFDRTDFSDREVHHAIRSGAKTFNKRLRSGSIDDKNLKQLR